jgi:acetyl esterase/lipase
VTEHPIRAPLDPEIAAALVAASGARAAIASLSQETLGEVRALMARASPAPLSGAVRRTDHRVPGDGNVVVRVYRPIGAAGSLPCLFWIHGGGFVLGDFSMADERFDAWCPHFGCVGASVQYRLAPETSFPGPLEDCYRGLLWVYRHADLIGVDASCLGVGGQSAGAGLAAGTALMARDRRDIPIAFQMLLYPMLDDRLQTPSSRWADPVWPPAANAFGWASYLGDRMGPDGVNGYAAPARAVNLVGLPPTFIAVGAIDGFSDEDIDYAVRLRHAGVPVDLHVYAGAPHGFDGLAPSSNVARRARMDVEAWLSARLGS